MSDRRSILSFISDRTIGAKVAAGFAVVLLILALSSAFAWLAFGRASGAVDEYAGLFLGHPAMHCRQEAIVDDALGCGDFRAVLLESSCVRG